MKIQITEIHPVERVAHQKFDPIIVKRSREEIITDQAVPMIEVIPNTKITVGVDVIHLNLPMEVITIHEVENQKNHVNIKIKIEVDHVIIKNIHQMMKNVIKRKRKKVRGQGLVLGQDVRL